MAQQAIIAQAGPDGSLVPQATDRENQRRSHSLARSGRDRPNAGARPAPAARHFHGGSRPFTPRPVKSPRSCRSLPTRCSICVLDELAADSVLWREENAVRTTGVPALPRIAPPANPVPIDLMREQDRPRSPGGFTARLAVILLAAGPCGYGLGILGDRNRQAGRLRHKRKSTFLADLDATKCHRDS